MKILLSYRIGFFLRKLSFRRTKIKSIETNPRLHALSRNSLWVRNEVAQYPTQKSLFCLLLTSDHTVINIFIFWSCHQQPTSSCPFPCHTETFHHPCPHNLVHTLRKHWKAEHMLPWGSRSWVVFASTAQGNREPWHCDTAAECAVLAGLIGAFRVSLATCTCTPRCVLWLENSSTKCHPTYSLITLCPIAPPQEHRQTTIGRNKSCSKLPKAQGKEFWARAGGESRPPTTQASSAQHCSRCYQLQNGPEPLEFHYITADEQWCRSAAAGAASPRVDNTALPSQQRRWLGRSQLLNSPTN